MSGLLLGAWVDATEENGLADLGYWIVYIGAAVLWTLVCWPLYEAISFRRGRSLGKRAFGLTVVPADERTPSFSSCAARGMLVAWPLAAGLFLYAVPTVVYAGWLAWDAARRPGGRTWVDRRCGSLVVAA